MRIIPLLMLAAAVVGPMARAADGPRTGTKPADGSPTARTTGTTAASGEGTGAAGAGGASAAGPAGAGAAGPGGAGAAGPGGAPGAEAGGSQGVVVRLEAGGETLDTPVVAHLKPDVGATTDVQLKDDGAPPDVASGDGTWSGTMWNEHDLFDVTLSLGAKTLEGGKVSWSKGDLQRDLSLSISGGQLKAEAGVAGTGENSPGGGPPAGGAPGGAGGSPSAGKGGFQLEGTSGGTASTPPFATSSDDATLYVALGAGGLLLAGIGYLYQRGGSRTPPGALPAGVTRVPAVGVLGPGTPAVADGLTQWVVAPNDAHDLLRLLLATLARHHRVVVSAPARSAIPSVPGGPVYRVAAGKPSALSDAVEGIADLAEPEALPIAVLLLGDGMDAASLKAHGEVLPANIGGAILVMQVVLTSAPAIQCERRGELWHFRYGSAEIMAREREDGFERV